jgi:hypothetical protein
LRFSPMQAGISSSPFHLNRFYSPLLRRDTKPPVFEGGLSKRFRVGSVAKWFLNFNTSKLRSDGSFARAQLLSTDGEPYWRAPVLIPSAARELFFDVEVDSMRDICYLHGFVERHVGDNATERFVL